jgi:hypothetical protein
VFRGCSRRGLGHKRGVLRDESGQSLVEFALSIFLVFGLLFFFIQLALMLSWGNFVQYATFMSARAYLSGGVNRGDQEERAQDVLRRMVKRGNLSTDDRFPAIARGYQGDDAIVKGASIGAGPGFSETAYALSWMQGVRYTFRSRLFVLPVGKASDVASGQVTLTSESWLGREPTYQECKSVMDRLMGQIDNGC